MNDLINVYSPYNKLIGDEFKTFSLFYSGDIKLINKWFEDKLNKKPHAKDSSKSLELRNFGNNCYCKGLFKESLSYYTKALKCAVFDSEEYGLALANRSAASFALKDYKNCIRDIDICLGVKYSKLYKIYIRKAECLEKLNRLDDKFIQECKKFLNKCDIIEPDKDKYLNKLQTLKTTNFNEKEIEENIPCIESSLRFIENDNFAFASDSIKLCYTKEKGRHVIAKKKVFQGDVLFIEKAFSFAPIFNEDDEFTPNKCYCCLKSTLTPIPCKCCALCEYCDDNCRDRSWDEIHKWECDGMTINLWYDTGIALPAFKTLVKGINSDFDAVHGDTINDFGDKNDNYRYFNSLMSHLKETTSLHEFLILSTVVVIYLERKTNFFAFLKDAVNYPAEELITRCGGLLVRHMLQLSCNSSLIGHWILNEDERMPRVSQPVACGIYPSVSMMNHSCEPFVSMYYSGDIVTVKALRDFNPGEEICNSYGVHYRYMRLEERRERLRSFYYFDCKCRICSDRSLDVQEEQNKMENCQNSDLTVLANIKKKLIQQQQMFGYLTRSSIIEGIDIVDQVINEVLKPTKEFPNRKKIFKEIEKVFGLALKSAPLYYSEEHIKLDDIKKFITDFNCV